MRRIAAVITGVVMFWGAAVAHANSTGPIVSFQTTLGNIVVQLLQNDAPKTVANFMDYVNAGAYNGTLIHRSVTNFVIQGGGYTYANGAVAAVPAVCPYLVPAPCPVVNEAKNSNVVGTLAMALVPNADGSIQPNSATDQWFFNTVNNSSSLDPKGNSSQPVCTSSVTTNCYSKGYTVFGKVLGSSSLSVIQSIASEPVADLDCVFGQGSSATIFQDTPVLNSYSPPSGCSTSTVPSDDLVFVNAISVVSAKTPPTITVNTPANGQQFDQSQVTLSDFTCSDGLGAGVETCNGPAKIDTSHVGTHTFTVTATDFAGLTATKVVHYVVDPLPPPPPAAPLFTFPKSAQLSSRGVVTVTIRCGTAGGCHGRLTLAGGSRRTSVASARLSMYNGQTRQLKLGLSSKGRRMVRHGRLSVWLTVRLTGHRAVTRKLSLSAK